MPTLVELAALRERFNAAQDPAEKYKLGQEISRMLQQIDSVPTNPNYVPEPAPTVAAMEFERIQAEHRKLGGELPPDE